MLQYCPGQLARGALAISMNVAKLIPHLLMAVGVAGIVGLLKRRTGLTPALAATGVVAAVLCVGIFALCVFVQT